MPKTSLDYWQANWRTSFSAWEGLQGMVALLVWVITIGVYLGLVKDTTDRIVDAVLGVALLGWLPIIVLVFTPRKMWIEAQSKIAEFEERFTPKLKIELDERSVKHETHRDNSVESWVRLKIANCSDEALLGVAVTIEECTPTVELPIPFELSDAYCDQPPLPIPARDQRYVELVRSAGGALHLRMYASSGATIPRNEYAFRVRASTRNYPCRDEKTVRVKVGDDGKLSCDFLESGEAGS